MLTNFIYRSVRWTLRLPGIEKTRFLWEWLRRPYYKLLNLDKRGVAIVLGPGHVVRVPAEFTSMSWEQHEPECAAAAADFLGRYPSALFLDIGCFVGFYSVLALFNSKATRVIAFDADITGLKATRYACTYAGIDRLRLVYGLVSDSHGSRLGLDDALAHTERMLRQSQAPEDPHMAHYVCLHGNKDSSIPAHSLDGLFFTGSALPDTPLLIKCDVEGAELLVLKGADRLLRERPVHMLVEIHDKMSDYGSSRQDIRSYLSERGYRVEPIATKTGREYWWCERKE